MEQQILNTVCFLLGILVDADVFILFMPSVRNNQILFPPPKKNRNRESQGHEKSFSPPLYFNEIWSTLIPLDHALPLTLIKYCHHHLLQADQIHVSVKRHYVFVRFKQRPLDITFFISVLATQGHSTVRFKKYLFERQKI